MNKTKIPNNLLERIAHKDDRALMLELYLNSNSVGIVRNTYDIADISNLIRANLIMATEEYIIINRYIDYNHSARGLNEKCNTHATPLREIEEAGFSYNLETKKIEVDENALIKPIDISNYVSRGVSSGKPSKKRETPANSLKTPNSKLMVFLSSNGYSLFIVVLLMMFQSFHTYHALTSISKLPDTLNEKFSIGAAFTLDSLILFFIARGDKTRSLVAMSFCCFMTFYSCHLVGVEYLSLEFGGILLLALYLPYSVHAVTDNIAKQHSTNPK